MNGLFRGQAEWRKSTPTGDGSVLDSVFVDNIQCRKYQGKKKAQKIVNGNSVARTVNLTLISSSPMARLIDADDELVWNGETYSVISTESVPSARKMGAEDIVIYLE